MANDYCSAADLKASLPDTSWSDTSYDALLTSLATRASRAIDRAAKRWPGYFYVSADSVRYFDGSGNRLLLVDDLAALPTTVEVAEAGDLTDYTLWAATDYIVYPLNALAVGLPYTTLVIDSLNGSKTLWYGYPKAIKITGAWGGFASLPEEVKEIAIIQGVRWFKRHQQAFKDSGAIQELSQMTFVKGLDPDVEEMLLDGLLGVTI